VSGWVTLTLRSPGEQSIDGDCIAADRFLGLSEREIATLPIWSGRRNMPLGDVFDVDGGHSSQVRVVGDVRRVNGIGTAMAGGEIIIDGDAGAHVAAGMTAGRVEILGSVGDDAGVGMSGGSLHIRGNAGDRVGGPMPGASRGMTGGEIVVEDSIGADAGARMRRGLLFAGGDAGDRAARAIIAGTVIVIGRVGVEPAAGSKRGTLVVGGGVDVPATYRHACDYEPPHVRLALTYLTRRYGLSIYRHLIDGRYRRYCGDASTVAKGEILEWLPE
jgi:formylmethanofuran dehydrogenase subunit C